MLFRSSGAVQGANLRRHVVASETLTHKTGRCEFRPATIVGHLDNGLEVVETLPAVHSARLGPMTAADGLILIPAALHSVPKNSLLEFMPFNRT